MSLFTVALLLCVLLGKIVNSEGEESYRYVVVRTPNSVSVNKTDGARNYSRGGEDDGPANSSGYLTLRSANDIAARSKGGLTKQNISVEQGSLVELMNIPEPRKESNKMSEVIKSTKDIILLRRTVCDQSQSQVLVKRLKNEFKILLYKFLNTLKRDGQRPIRVPGSKIIVETGKVSAMYKQGWFSLDDIILHNFDLKKSKKDNFKAVKLNIDFVLTKIRSGFDFEILSQVCPLHPLNNSASLDHQDHRMKLNFILSVKDGRCYTTGQYIKLKHGKFKIVDPYKSAYTRYQTIPRACFEENKFHLSTTIDLVEQMVRSVFYPSLEHNIIENLITPSLVHTLTALNEKENGVCRTLNEIISCEDSNNLQYNHNIGVDTGSQDGFENLQRTNKEEGSYNGFEAGDGRPKEGGGGDWNPYESGRNPWEGSRGKMGPYESSTIPWEGGRDEAYPDESERIPWKAVRGDGGPYESGRSPWEGGRVEGGPFHGRIPWEDNTGVENPYESAVIPLEGWRGEEGLYESGQSPWKFSRGKGGTFESGRTPWEGSIGAEVPYESGRNPWEGSRDYEFPYEPETSPWEVRESEGDSYESGSIPWEGSRGGEYPYESTINTRERGRGEGVPYESGRSPWDGSRGVGGPYESGRSPWDGSRGQGVSYESGRNPWESGKGEGGPYESGRSPWESGRGEAVPYESGRSPWDGSRGVGGPYQSGRSPWEGSRGQGVSYESGRNLWESGRGEVGPYESGRTPWEGSRGQGVPYESGRSPWEGGSVEGGLYESGRSPWEGSRGQGVPYESGRNPWEGNRGQGVPYDSGRNTLEGGRDEGDPYESSRSPWEGSRGQGVPYDSGRNPLEGGIDEGDPYESSRSPREGGGYESDSGKVLLKIRVRKLQNQ